MFDLSRMLTECSIPVKRARLAWFAEWQRGCGPSGRLREETPR
jgi:hypothetical protein